jgi:hypothetical protein
MRVLESQACSEGECCVTPFEAIGICVRAHYYLMKANRNFWSDKGDMEASRLLCVAASDLRRAQP